MHHRSLLLPEALPDFSGEWVSGGSFHVKHNRKFHISEWLSDFWLWQIKCSWALQKEDRREASEGGVLFVVHWLGDVRFFATSWTVATPGSSVLHYLPEFAQMYVHCVVMLSNHLILCHPLLLLPSVFPSIRVYSSELALHQMAKGWELQLQHQSFPWIFRVDFF